MRLGALRDRAPQIAPGGRAARSGTPPRSDGTTIAAQYARLGINLRCGNTDRVNGWAEVLQRLGDAAGGVPPSLFMHRRCARLLETLPALQHDPNRPEDVPESYQRYLANGFREAWPFTGAPVRLRFTSRGARR